MHIKLQKMRKLLILLFFFISLTSCKKEYHFSKNDITQRDSNGNITGNINPEDWHLKPLSDADVFTQSVFNKIPQNLNDNLINYTMNCQDTFQFDMKAYPNPMGRSINLKFNLQTNLIYKKGFIIIVDRKGNYLSAASFTSPFVFRDELINKLVNRDFIYYYILITEDNCGYYGKGNVIGSK